DAFGDNLGALAGKIVAGRSMVVVRQVRKEDLRRCHLVYLSEDDERLNRSVVNELRGQPVALVGERAGASLDGVMISLFKDNGHIGFEVDLEATQLGNLRVSAQLLKLARQVRGKQ
ncbi:MAG: hypothetical protein RLZZ401_677, partial [Pseudomonadota bacterium]